MKKIVAISSANPDYITDTADKIRLKLMKSADILQCDSAADITYAIGRPNDVILIGSIATVLTKEFLGDVILTEDVVFKAIQFHKAITHHIVIPYTLDYRFFVQDSVLQRLVQTILPQIPTVLLANRSKEDNWKVIVAHLTGLVI